LLRARGMPNTVLGFNIHGKLGQFTCWILLDGDK
jgi:hypothetical protein